MTSQVPRERLNHAPLQQFNQRGNRQITDDRRKSARPTSIGRKSGPANPSSIFPLQHDRAQNRRNDNQKREIRRLLRLQPAHAHPSTIVRPERDTPGSTATSLKQADEQRVATVISRDQSWRRVHRLTANSSPAVSSQNMATAAGEAPAFPQGS